MLPPSLRPLVLHQARTLPLQLQRRLKSTDPVATQYTDFLEWVRKHQGKHRAKQSSPVGGAQGNKSSKKKKAKKSKGPGSPHPTLEKPRNAMTREQRIRDTVWATFRGKQPLTPGASHWSPEDWKTENWGLDSKSCGCQISTPLSELTTTGPCRTQASALRSRPCR